MKLLCLLMCKQIENVDIDIVRLFFGASINIVILLENINAQCTPMFIVIGHAL